MTRTIRLLLAMSLLGCALLSACDIGTRPTATPVPSPQPTTQVTLGGLPVGSVTPADTPTPLPAPTGTAVDVASATAPAAQQADVPTPSPVTAAGTGEAITALHALAVLKGKALGWQQDARLAMLSDARPGQEANLLRSAPGDPNVSEPTPGGRGRNWTLVAFSPSANGAMAFGMDGSQTDLVKAGAVTNDMLSAFSAPGLSELDLASLDPAQMADSDRVASQGGQNVPGATMGIALIAPDGLGMGPLPTPQAGGKPAQLAYQLFSTDPNDPYFAFYDATTGALLMDSNTP